MYILSCASPEKGGGVYRCEIDENKGLRILGYLPCDRPMYAVKENDRLRILLRQPFKNSENSGYFSCLENFTDISETADTLGKVACHLCVSRESVYIVNYLSGNIVKDCEVTLVHSGQGKNPQRQEAPHTHCVIPSPCGEYILCTDLGTDTLYIYDKNLNLVSSGKVPDGYGIRHIVFSKDGNYIYAINELVPSVSIFSWQNGKVCSLGCEKLTDRQDATGAAIRLSDDGAFLYCSVRGENSLYVFKTQKEGALKFVQKTDSFGDGPRDFNLYQNKYLICCNENSGNVTVFPLKNGKIGNKAGELKLLSPLCCVTE